MNIKLAIQGWRYQPFISLEDTIKIFDDFKNKQKSV